MPKGSDLRRERHDYLPIRVTVTAVGKHMGLSRQTVHGIEKAELVDDATATRYRLALARAAHEVTTGTAA